MSQTKAQLIDPVDGTIVNADINASAAIAGSKISPDFGSQNIVTTGETTTSDVFLGDSILHTGDTNTKIRFPAADTVSIETGGSERLRIDSSGRLQQGSDTSNLGSAKLNIVTGGEDGISIGRAQSGNVSNGDVLGTYAFQSSIGSQTTNSAEASIKGIAAQDSTGSTAATDLAFFTKPSGTGPGSSPTERLRISSSGKVGIGLNSPSRMLQVKSSAANSTHISLVDNDSTNEVFRVGQQSDGDGFLQLLDDSGAVQTGLEATGDSFFVGGNVGIGTSSPSAALHIVAGGNNLKLSRSSFDDFQFGIGTVGGINGLFISNTTDDFAAVSISEGCGANALVLASGGKLGIGNNAPAFTLDARRASEDSLRIGNTNETGHGTHNAKIVAGNTYYQDLKFQASDVKFETYNGSSLGERFRVRNNGGVTFNGDTADVNALDDYEEGTWSPVYFFNSTSSGVTQPSTRNGKYTKIGNRVYINCHISGTTGSHSGFFQIGGLPFNVSSDSSTNYSALAGWVYAGFDNNDQIIFRTNPNSPLIEVQRPGFSVFSSEMNHNANYMIAGHYKTDS